MRILIVDDDKDLVSYLKRGFEAESFAVDAAYDGAEGSYAARTNHYDLIILDNVMPKKLGLEVCAELRAKGVNTPIMMLSVRSEIPEKIALFHAGIDDYVVKPYSFEEVLARSRALLRRGRKTQDPVYDLEGLLIDTSARTVTLDRSRWHSPERHRFYAAIVS